MESIAITIILFTLTCAATFLLWQMMRLKMMREDSYHRTDLDAETWDHLRELERRIENLEAIFIDMEEEKTLALRDAEEPVEIPNRTREKVSA